MDLIILTLGIVLSTGISLGVGSSTLAILNFFHAISDGKIDETERNFMGITYIVLRVAMGLILVSTLTINLLSFLLNKTSAFAELNIAIAVLIAVLFLNAYLMTIRFMPSTFGPAIQASSWYTLGIMTSMSNLGISINFLIFLFAYATAIFFAISLINAIMAGIKERLPGKPSA